MKKVDINKTVINISDYYERLTEYKKIYDSEVKQALGNFENERKKYYLYLIIFKIILVTVIVTIGIVSYHLIKMDTRFIELILLFILVFIPIVLPLIYIIRNKILQKFKDSYKSSHPYNKLLNCFGDLKWQNLSNPKLNVSSQLERLSKVYNNDVKKYIAEQGETLSTIETIKNLRINDSGLFITSGDRDKWQFDDCFTGTYKDVKYTVCEAKKLLYITEQRCSEDRYIPCFKGVVLKLEIDKNFQSKTILSQKYDFNITSNYPLVQSIIFFTFTWIFLLLMQRTNGYSLSGIMLGIIFTLLVIMLTGLTHFWLSKTENLQKVMLESDKFNEKYNVYSTDQIEARYLVTTAFMDRLQNLKTHFGAKKVKCSFYDGNKLMIVFHTNKDLFELGDLDHSLYTNNKHIELFNSLYSVIELIEYFKLNQKTGL